jgi:hypothetical protein
MHWLCWLLIRSARQRASDSGSAEAQPWASDGDPNHMRSLTARSVTHPMTMLVATSESGLAHERHGLMTRGSNK